MFYVISSSPAFLPAAPALAIATHSAGHIKSVLQLHHILYTQFSR